MTWRGGLTSLVTLLMFFTVQAACEGRDNAGGGDSSVAQAAREAGVLTEVTLRIDGMT